MQKMVKPFMNIPKEIYMCPNCGNEVRSEWCGCPYCTYDFEAVWNPLYMKIMRGAHFPAGGSGV